MQESVPRLREVKKAETRRRLITSARTAALAHGLDAVTVEAVCGEAGVSVRTFFNYFDSKESAVLGDEPPLGTPASRAAFVAGGPSGDLLADLLALLDPSAALEDEGRDGLLLALQLAQREPRLLAVALARQSAQDAEIASLVADRRGLPAADAACTAVAAVAHAVLRSAFHAWFDAADDSLLSSHVEVAQRSVLALLAPPVLVIGTCP